MNLAKNIRKSLLRSLVELAVTSERFRGLSTSRSCASGSALFRRSPAIQLLPSLCINSHLLWRSLVTLEQAQGQIDELNDAFVQARDEIEFAQEDAETTYFNESHQLAKESVTVVTTLYQGIQADLSEADRGKLQRSMGLKMEQLKAELGQLDTMHT